MIIKKLEEDITYKAETAMLLVEVNGKKVRVCDWYKQDNLNSDYDQDTEIDEDDREALTEEEDEELSDVLQDLRHMKVGEVMDTEQVINVSDIPF